MGQQMADTKRRKRKRLVLKEGDIFEFGVPDGRLGYGVIVMPNSGVPYVIILASLHQSRPSIAEIAGDQIALVGWTTDALIYHDRWRIVGHDFPRRIDIPFPNWKVGMEGKTYVTDVTGELIDEATPEEEGLLDYQFSRSAISYQNAFEALSGFNEWDESHEKITPAYARQRITRASPRAWPLRDN